MYGQSDEITSDDKLWVVLAYIFSPLIPVIIMFMNEKKARPFVRAHNAQALVLGVIALVVNSVLAPIGIGCITSIAYLILIIMYAVKANKGEYITIPMITDFCKNQGWA